MKLFRFVVAIILLTSCSKDPQSGTVAASTTRQAPAEISKSLNAVKTAEGKNLLSVKKASLGKNFLLLTSYKAASVDPKWTDLAPVMVSFELSGDRLALFEVRPAVYDTPKPEGALLATFAVTAQTDEEVTFAWDMGLRSIPNHGNMGPGDHQSDDNSDNAAGSEEAFTVKESFTRSASVENNELHVVQAIRYETQEIKQTNGRESGRNVTKNELRKRDAALTASFLIRPYLVNPGFRTQKADDKGAIGFFTVPVLKSGDAEFEEHVMKWDVDPARGPITYILSSNAPEAYRSAVTEGVLYWNRVLGRDVFQVKTGADPDSLPADRTVVIRWIPWENAGAGWASIQADPLTGEILRGQIFFPLSFPAAAEFRLRGFSPKTTTPGAGAPARFTFAGLRSASVRCVAGDITGVTPDPAVNPDAIPALILDRIRAVAAHEVGHTLGLRHNFAAGFASELTPEAQAEAQNRLYSDPAAPGAHVATSVMDYLIFRDDLLTGRAIRTDALAYDKMAIGWAYSNGVAADPKVSPYCTDENIDRADAEEGIEVYGCSRSDTTTNPLRGELLRQNISMHSALFGVLQKELSLLFPASGKGIAMNDLIAEIADTSHSEFKPPYFPAPIERLNHVLFVKKIDGEERAQAIGIARAKETADHISVYPDNDLFSLATRHIAEAGGVDKLVAGALLVDPATGLVDSAKIKGWIEDVFSSRAREGETSEGVRYSLSVGDWERLKAATGTRWGSDIFTTVGTLLYSVQPAKDRTDDDGKGNRTKFDVVVASNGPLSQEEYVHLIGLAGRMYEAPGEKVEVKNGVHKIEVTLPIYESYVRAQFLGFFDSALFGRDTPAERSQLIERRLDWLRNLASIDKPAEGVQDPQELKKRIDDLCYQREILPQKVCTAVSYEVEGIKKLLDMK